MLTFDPMKRTEKVVILRQISTKLQHEELEQADGRKRTGDIVPPAKITDLAESTMSRKGVDGFNS